MQNYPTLLTGLNNFKKYFDRKVPLVSMSLYFGLERDFWGLAGYYKDFFADKLNSLYNGSTILYADIYDNNLLHSKEFYNLIADVAYQAFWCGMGALETASIIFVIEYVQVRGFLTFKGFGKSDTFLTKNPGNFFIKTLMSKSLYNIRKLILEKIAPDFKTIYKFHKLSGLMGNIYKDTQSADVQTFWDGIHSVWGVSLGKFIKYLRTGDPL